MRLIALAIALVTPLAHGQWGIGSALGNTCPYNYGPASAAFDNSDEVRNLRGQYAQAERQLVIKRNKLARLDAELKEAKRDMRTVLSQKVIDVITEHRIYNRGRGSYQRNCGDGYGSRFPGRSGSNNPNLPPTPSEFCYTDTKTGERVNTWLESFAMEEGQVSETICDYKIQTPQWGIAPSIQDSRTCKRGLKDYDNLIAEKVNLEQEIADLDSQLRDGRRRMDRIAEDFVEGRTCTTCNSVRRGQSTIGSTDQMMGLAGVALMMGVAAMTRNNQPRPPMFGGMPMPFGGGFPGQPFGARMPGYMGVGPGGCYGCVPGAIGPGAFGCQGTNPMMAGNGFAPPTNPMLVSPYLSNPMLAGNPALMGNPAMAGAPFLSPLFAGQPGAWGQPNLFSNPFSTPFMNPGFQNSLLNNGFGPGFMPMIGNGIPGYQMYNPLAQLYNPMQNANAPAVLPYLGGDPFSMNPNLQHPYFNQGYQFNPFYNPNGGYGPYGGGYPFGGYDPYGMNNMYGMNGAPPILPMMGGMGGMGGYGGWGGGMNTPYSIPLGGGIPGAQSPFFAGGIPYGSPLSNYNMQMDLLNRNIQMISSGSAWNPNAPPVLPFPGPGLNPFYRQPVQPQPMPISPGFPQPTPLPRQPPPMPVQPQPQPLPRPPNPPAPPPTGPIRTR